MHPGPQKEVDLLLQCGGAGEEASRQPKQLPTSGLVLTVIVRELSQELTVNLIPQRFLRWWGGGGEGDEQYLLYIAIA